MGDAVSEIISKARTVLEKASYELRRNGCHVYYDPRDIFLWVFHVPVSDSEDHKFKELLVGIEAACGLHGA